MKKQTGFTLIELVIVIIILGILAAVAVPKFIDLQGDARVSALKGVKSALEGGATLTYSKAAIDGIETGDATAGADFDLGDGTIVDTAYGYPVATDDGIAQVVELSTNDWGTNSFGVDDTLFFFASSANATTDGTECAVSYVYDPDVSGSRPTITVIEDGC